MMENENMSPISDSHEINAESHNRKILISMANELCERSWDDIRIMVENDMYDPYDVEDLARRGVALADLAWALQLPEEEPGHLGADDIMRALGKEPGELLDPGIAHAAVWNIAEHGQMQVEAFSDYLKSGELSADIRASLNGDTSYFCLSKLVKDHEPAHKTGNPTDDDYPGVPGSGLYRGISFNEEPKDIEGVEQKRKKPHEEEHLEYSLENLNSTARAACGHDGESGRLHVDNGIDR